MGKFEERIEEFSTIFSNQLKKFDEETAPLILGVLARQICSAEEFKKVSMNIKVAC